MGTYLNLFNDWPLDRQSNSTLPLDYFIFCVCCNRVISCLDRPITTPKAFGLHLGLSTGRVGFGANLCSTWLSRVTEKLDSYSTKHTGLTWCFGSSVGQVRIVGLASLGYKLVNKMNQKISIKQIKQIINKIQIK